MDIVGAANWADIADPDTGDITPGIRSKLETDRWKAKEEKDSPAIDQAKIDAKLAEMKKQVQRWIDNDNDTMMIAEFSPPEVVIADTNWGNPVDQTVFVIAPDPSTGEFRMWKKENFSGNPYKGTLPADGTLSYTPMDMVSD